MSKGYEQAVDNLAYHIALLWKANGGDPFIFWTDVVSRKQARAIDKVVEAVAKEYDISEEMLMCDVMDQVDARVTAIEMKEAIEGFFLK